MSCYERGRVPLGCSPRWGRTLFELLEIRNYGLVRMQQVRECLVAQLRARSWHTSIFQKRPEPLADVGWQHSFEILQRGSPQALIVRVQAAERDAQRIGWQRKSEQREHVCQALVCPVA